MPRLVLAAALALAPSAARAVYVERLIQIGIAHGVRELTLTPEGRCTLRDEAAGEAHALLPLKAYRVESEGAGLRFGPYHITGPARLVPLEPGATVVAGNGRYKGDLIVKPNGDETLTVIAELGVEDYLLGVLPREMEPNWPLQALKAQAVVARTFAYYHLGRYKRSGFDLTSDTRSQMYGGVGYESETVRRAVRETRGEVLGFRGALLAAYYHACCGGHTADYGMVWGHGAKAPAPLRGVKDRYCPKSALGRWTIFIPSAEVLAALQSRRLIGGRLKAFRMGRRDPAGYVRSFTAKVGGKTMTVNSEDFRRAVGPTQLRSLRLRSVRLRRGGVEFAGSGSGHGVGLCQWGARLQAQLGRTYEAILEYYFPGATLSVVDE